jgi:hypothetical protein
MNARSIAALLLIAVLAACEPTKEEYYYINARTLLHDSRAEQLPDRTSIATLNVACKKAQQDRERLRTARKLADECDPLPEVWYYQKALAVFPAVVAGTLDLRLELRQACEAANTTLTAALAPGAPKDRDRLPNAQQLAAECEGWTGNPK